MIDESFYVDSTGPFVVAKGNFDFFIAMPRYVKLDVIQSKLHERFQEQLIELCKEYRFSFTDQCTYLDSSQK